MVAFISIFLILHHPIKAENIQTYNATEFGFSFKYSADNFLVGNDTNNTDGGWIYVLPIASTKNQAIEEAGAIVISPRKISPSETPLDWLKSSNSGYDVSQGYETIQVGGQQAISVKYGKYVDWLIVNTPDNKERLSIAILPPSATSTDLTVLHNEMATIVSSLSFEH